MNDFLKRTAIAYLLSGGGRLYYNNGDLRSVFEPATSSAHLPVVYVPPNEPKTLEQIEQFQAGIKNNAAFLYKLMSKGIGTEHYNQGLLSYAAYNNQIEMLKYLLSDDPPTHRPLSVSYKRNNALYNAVRGAAGKTQACLLTLGAEPKQIIRDLKRSIDSLPDSKQDHVRRFIRTHELSQRPGFLMTGSNWSSYTVK